MSATASRLPAVDGHLIDEYVAGLSRRLVGPRRAKAELLTEARDGLVDAAEAYADAGLPARDAAALAVADFGGYRQVVRSYQAELAAAQGRRTALLVSVVMPVLPVATRLMWLGSPWSGGPGHPGSGYLLFASGLDILQVTAAIMGLLTLLGFGWGSRYLPAVRVPAAVLLARLMGVGVLFFLGAEMLTGVVVYAWSVHLWPASATWPPMLAGAVVLPVLFAGVARSALRCLRASGGTGRPLVSGLRWAGR